MPGRPLVLVHGYSDTAKGFHRWVQILTERGYDVQNIRVTDYKSLTNEVTIKDLGEGLERALRATPGLEKGQPFDAIVHSTGGLVIRTWLTGDKSRRERLKHVVMLAPANFGSPMAHKGRSTLGAVFKGSHDFGPDFMEAGDRILSELELGSAYTWNLAMQDLLHEEDVYYGAGTDTPYAFVCIGNKDYGLFKRIVTEAGTDGTVRWSGCGLNARRITVDLTRDKGSADAAQSADDRIKIHPWANEDMPLFIAQGLNHGTIMGDPSSELVDMVDEALNVESKADLDRWCVKSSAATAALDDKTHRYQQFVIRAVDERGDPIPDYHLEFLVRDDDGELREVEFAADVHPYTDDTSYRCFHINLSEQSPDRLPSLVVRIIASSGTAFIGYHGFGSHRASDDLATTNEDGKWDAEIDLTSVLKGKAVKGMGGQAVSFFHPFTTTLVEIRLNREPEPLIGVCKVLGLLAAEELLQRHK